MQPVDKRGTIQPAAPLVEVRGPSGRLYGMLDPQQQIIEFKRGKQKERIDLRPYLEAAKQR
jgi:hypothetical protein